MQKGSGRLTSDDHRRRKFLITNCVAQNGGDSAILESLLLALRRGFGDGTEFIVVDDRPHEVAALIPGMDLMERISAVVHRPGRGSHTVRRLVIRTQELLIVLAAWLWGRGLRTPAGWLIGARTERLFEALESVDAVVSTGGTYLVETYDVASRLFELEVPLAMGKPPPPPTRPSVKPTSAPDAMTMSM